MQIEKVFHLVSITEIELKSLIVEGNQIRLCVEDERLMKVKNLKVQQTKFRTWLVVSRNLIS